MVPLLNPEDLNGPFINYSITEKINFDSLGDLGFFIGIQLTIYEEFLSE